MSDTREQQYECQANIFQRYAQGGPEEDLAESWIDGRYGCDVAYLNSKGLPVLATDIDDILLREFVVAPVPSQ